MPEQIYGTNNGAGYISFMNVGTATGASAMGTGITINVSESNGKHLNPEIVFRLIKKKFTPIGSIFSKLFK